MVGFLIDPPIMVMRASVVIGLHMTSQTLRNHFRVAKESASIRTRRVVYVGGDATKHVQLPISSESTGLVVLQWFDRVALTIAQLELLRIPGRAGIPFYRLLTRS